MVRHLLAALALACVWAISPAQAQPRHHHAAIASGKPEGCPHAWCGCWLMHRLGLADRRLWLARAWATLVGSPAPGPAPGVIAVWRHHVGQITAVTGPGRFMMVSGNDGHAVRERERSAAGVIAYRVL